jgi:hypothetical protein
MEKLYIIFFAGIAIYLPIGFATVRKFSARGCVLTLFTVVLGLLTLSGIAEVWLFALLVFWVMLLVFYTILYRGEIEKIRAELKSNSISHILLKGSLKERIYFFLWGSTFIFTLSIMLLQITQPARSG